MKTKSLNAKKQLERIISCKVSEGCYKDGNKVYESALTEDELRKRAAKIDSQLYSPNRKVNGGLGTQKAMLFIMQNRANINDITFRFASYGRHIYSAWLNNRKIAEVDFERSDFDYAKSLMRLS